MYVYMCAKGDEPHMALLGNHLQHLQPISRGEYSASYTNHTGCCLLLYTRSAAGHLLCVSKHSHHMLLHWIFTAAAAGANLGS